MSTKGRYAVMAVADLASMNSERPVPLAEIAERQEISLSYLEQLFSKMKRSGIVRSARGPGGGYMLAGPCAEITVAAVLNSIDDEVRQMRCSPSAPHLCRAGEERCATHDLWAMVSKRMETILDSVSLEDVCMGRISLDTNALTARAAGTE